MDAPAPPTSSVATQPERRLLRGLLALYIASALVVAIQRTLLSPENNFLIFRAAFDHLLRGQDLYAPYPGLHADFYKYSPTFALLFAPFALLPKVPGYMLWALTGAMSVYFGVTRLLPPRQAALALALAWLAVVGDMQRAQSNTLCAGLMILGWVALDRRQQWTAATAIAIGALVKLFPLATVAGAIFHPRKIRFAVTFLIVLAIAVALPLLVTSPHSLAMQYASWHAIESRDALPMNRLGTGGADLYAGLMGLLRVWGGIQWPYWPVQLAGVVVLLAPLMFHWRPEWGDRRFRGQLLASILVFCVLFNHQAESPSYVIAMIGTSIWYAASERAWWRTALMALSIVVVNLGSTDLMPRVWYHAYYVTYLLKTVPLIPVWVAMQGELLGLIDDGGPLEIGEIDQLETAPR